MTWEHVMYKVIEWMIISLSGSNTSLTGQVDIVDMKIIVVVFEWNISFN